MNVYYPITIFNTPALHIYTQKQMSQYFKQHLPVCSSIAPTDIWFSDQNKQPGNNDLLVIYFTTDTVQALKDSMRAFNIDGRNILFQYQLLLPILMRDMFLCNKFILNIIGIQLKKIIAIHPNKRANMLIQHTLNHYGCIVDGTIRSNKQDAQSDFKITSTAIPYESQVSHLLSALHYTDSSNSDPTDRDGNNTGKRITTFSVKPQYMTHIHQHNHGWFSKQTQYQVQVAIDHCRPHHIVELGSWYGTSSRFIADKMRKDSRLTCIDKFQLLIESPYSYDGYSPGDEFYFMFPRLETCMKNINDDRVTLIKGDIYTHLDVLIKKKTPVDMFFIDFEKNTKRLHQLLQTLRHHYPSCTIVGDDYIFEPVKAAVRGIPHTFTHCSYMINGPKFDYSSYPHKTLDWFLRNMKSHKLTKIHNKFHQSLYIRHLIKTRQFDKIVSNISFITVSWNMSMPDSNNSTLYHYLFCYCKDNNKLQHLLKILEAIEPIDRKKNNYMLTPYDFTHTGMERFLE